MSKNEQTALQRWLNRKKKGEQPVAVPEAPLLKDGDAESYPLSPAQSRIWLLQQLNPDNPFYHYAETYRLRGNLDVDQLKTAYKKVVLRHEILRATFKKTGEEVRQFIKKESTFDFKYHDLQDLPSDIKKDKSTSYAIQEANTPFSLEEGPLTRLVLLQLGPEDYILLIAMHHIVTDKWSMKILRNELVGFYNNRQFPNVQVQYPAYAASIDQSKSNEKGRNYWKEKLSQISQSLDLPFDKPRPETPSYEGGYRKTIISPRLTSELKEAARNNNVTLFAYLLTVYQVLLGQYSGEKEFAIGTPVSNRNEPRLEETIGFFNETVALKTDLSENPTFNQLVQKTRATVLEAFAHMDVPFEDVVQEVNPDRRPGVNPLFQTMFILHVVPETTSFGPNLQLDPVPLDAGVTKFDLTLYVSDEGDQLSVIIEYAADLFEKATIDRVQSHYHQLLAEVVANPESRVDQLSCLPPSEKRLILEDWNDTSAPLPDESTIHDLIHQAAINSPAAVAVAYADLNLTYQELEDRSENLAAQLRDLGVKSGDRIGLYVPVSLELVVGMLAILKAGGAYLPLDPEYPEDRINYLMEDAAVGLMLTTTALSDELSDQYQNKLVLVDAQHGKSKDDQLALSAQRKSPEVCPDDLAYMIYTSGSTGRPKGVMVSHANLVHSTVARHHYYPTKPSAFLLMSSFSFDSSVAGIFWALTTGAKLVLAPRRIEQDLEALADLIERQQVSHTLMLPTLYDTILRFTEQGKLSSLDSVIVAGEACSPAFVQRHYEALPGVRLFNEYGPTEASVWCTAYECTASDGNKPVPIGGPIPNASAYVLAADGKSPCPIGVVGELFIGGAGVSKGYWQRPDLTKERFVPNPFRPGEKLYRTGDRASWLADGNLQFRGRVDRQIKLRGYRIELGEIHEAILSFPEITGAVVKVDEAQQRLVAYFTSSTAMNIEALRKGLKDRLPKYMIPSFLVELDALPRLANGKIDEAGLPAPKQGEAQTTILRSTVDLSPEEATLLGIWQEALSQENIGVNDNFFEVGGDSILSIQIVARARKAGLRLSPRAIFEHQTIAELALFTSNASDRDTIELVYGDFPLLPIQRWFFEEHHTAPHHWNQAAVFELGHEVERLRVTEIVNKLLATHSGLRQEFSQNDDGKWRVSSPKVSPDHETKLVSPEEIGGGIDLLSIEKYLAAEQQNYPLVNASLVHSYLFPGGENSRARLVLVIHHLIVDVVSWRIIAEDLKQLLAEPNLAIIPSLAPATAPYSSWSRQLQRMTEQAHFATDLPFWEAQRHVDLPGVSSLNLPVAEDETELISAHLSKEETAPLLSGAHRAFNTTTQDLLLAALLTALGEKELHLNLEHNGREAAGSDTDFTRSIGWFTATYPLTLTLAEEMPQVIMEVKETLRRVPNKGLSYGALRYLGQYDLEHQPQLLFNYLGRIDTQPEKDVFSWRLLQNGLRSEQSERNRIWEINVGVIDGSLSVNWQYATGAYSSEMMNQFVSKYIGAIREIIQFCTARQEETFTPSDFPEANLSQDDLDNLLDQIDL